MSKAGIIKDFKVLAQLFKKAQKNRDGLLVPGKDPRRQTAYQNAASAVCVVQGDVIESIKVLKKGQKLPDGTGKATKREVYITTNDAANVRVPSGLGKATTDKIGEYMKTGKMKAAQQARAWLAQDTENEEKRELPPDQKALKVFEGIFNVGERTADVWLKQYKKIPTASRPSPLAWVRANKGDMPTTRGGSKPMSHAQLIGLKYYKDLQKRIPRYYIDIVQMMIRVVLFKTFGKGSYKMAVAGSYRRGAEDSGDIDIIFTSDKFDLTQAVAALEKWGIVVATMSVDKSKFTGVCHCPSGQWHYFHLDIVYSTEKAWEAALLWFTGSKGFNTKTRNKARKLGYTLNQYGLFKEADKGRKHLIALTEKDILAKIGEPYVPPECR